MKILSKLRIRTLDRYLLRGFTYSYVVSVVIMISLYIVLDLFANLDEFTESGGSTIQIASDIISFYFYHSFLYFAQVAGMITIVAGAFTLARLQKSNELTAILSGGISLHRVALPLIVAGLAFNMLWVVDQEFIIPAIADKLVLSHDEARGKRAFSLWFLKDRNNTLLSAMMYHPKTKTMEQMIAMERDSHGRIISKISADEAKWNDKKQCWDLVTRGAQYSRSIGKADFVVSAKMGRKPVKEYYSDWKPNDLLLRQSTNWTWFLSLRQLNSLLKRPYLVPNLTEIISARHVRLTQPVINILLLFLGLPFFLNREPHNVLVSVGLCLLVTILCFLMAFVSQNLAGTSTHPALAAWIPILIFGPLAALLMENVKT